MKLSKLISMLIEIEVDNGNRGEEDVRIVIDNASGSERLDVKCLIYDEFGSETYDDVLIVVDKLYDGLWASTSVNIKPN